MAQGKVTYNNPGWDFGALLDGSGHFRFWDDFLTPSFHTLANAASGDDTQILNNWSYTQNDSSTTFPVFTAAQEIAGGVLKYTSHTGDNDGIVFFPGFSVGAPASTDMEMECRMAITDIANTCVFFGLSETVADAGLVADGTGLFTDAAGGADRVGIGYDAATTTGKFDVLSSLNAAGLGGTDVAEYSVEFDAGATGTLASDEYVRLGLSVINGIARFYIDGSLVYTAENATTMSDQKLYPCLLMMNEEAAANVFYIDYFGVSAVRP
ncbi:MAG: hypothetical protein GOVbin1630_54 [Prokaryotic dsDNA virus sp.]|nr:MAG: hypothetical protein GOVbin1630_54 [Prokaryotic dsDNA virus sp.]|tara:strand:+ start:7982 stop:8782 length:801 start_codon:yes stop_codon:yes gene_type:complete